MATVVFDKDGNMTVNLDEIKRVGVENIIDVVSHRIMRESNKTIHEIEFIDDGKCRFAYTSEGKLVEFNIHHMSMTATKDNEVILRRYDNSNS